MQIGSGQSPLALAVLKTLGVQTPGGQQAALPAAPTAQAGPTAPGGKVAASGLAAGAAPAPAGPETGLDLGVAKTIPRGSFVDLKA